QEKDAESEGAENPPPKVVNQRGSIFAPIFTFIPVFPRRHHHVPAPVRFLPHGGGRHHFSRRGGR
ncbi:2411_t:CDS:1, partial [Acaulospora morrowiae]